MSRNATHILLVDDSFTLQKRLQSSLASAGFSVEVACNGSEALEKAQQQQFDLVVTDEQMPVMSGLSFCRWLRGDQRYTDTPIIFLTAARSKLDANELEELRVAAVFDKPFNPQLVVHFIEARRRRRPRKSSLLVGETTCSV